MRNDLFKILKSFLPLNRHYYMHTSTAQCFSAEMTLYSHLKCDGNESHSIRMLKRHLLLNSQTHTTTTRTTLRMYQCITVSHCISVAKMPPSMTAQSCTHRSVRTAATQVAPVTVPSLGKHTKKIFTCVQSLCSRANYHSSSTHLQNRG